VATTVSALPLRQDPGTGRPLVDCPESLSSEWLHSVLVASGLLDDQRIVAVAKKSIGNGMLGTNVLLSLTYDRPGRAPNELVAKFSSTRPESRDTGSRMGIYVKEVLFYRELAPTLKVDMPKAYFADISDDHRRFCILTESLLPATQIDQLDGCGLAEAENVMDAAAALHGPRWGDPTLGNLTWLDRAMPVGFYAQQMKACTPGLEQRLGHLLDADDLSVCQQLADRIDAYFALQTAPWTVTHQDFRLDNILFASSGGKRPVSVLDWQTVILGPGVTDVAYFIGAGLPEDLRRRHESDLVRRYHEGLQAFGVRDLSLDQCWMQYRLYALQGLITGVIATFTTGRTERGDQLFSTMIRRHAKQALELDSLGLIGKK
jgi:hypothetical protein